MRVNINKKYGTIGNQDYGIYVKAAQAPTYAADEVENIHGPSP